MKILITGADGQLGTTLREVLSAGCSDLGSIPVAYGGAQVIALALPDLDVGEKARVHEALLDHRPEVVFHLAAHTKVDQCEDEPDLAARVNALGARNVALAAQAVGSKLVHLSTDYVFPGDVGTPYREWDLPRPESIYGYSKYLGEQYVRDFCEKYFIVRTSWLYSHTGQNFVRTILRLAREREEIQVVEDQCGNPTNAQDLVHHLLKIALTGEYGLYHCTGAGCCSWFAFATEIVAQAGLPCRVVPCDTEALHQRAKRPPYSALDHQMLRYTVGDEMRDWKEALSSLMRTYDKESGEFIR